MGDPQTALKDGLRIALAADSPLRRMLPDDTGERLRQVRRHLPTRAARALDRQIGGAGLRLDQAQFAAAFDAASVRPHVPAEPIRLWIAPANFAGQGRAWAEAVNRHLPGASARNMAVAGRIPYVADQLVAPQVYRDIAWQRAQERYVLQNYTHVLVESERPVFGTLYGRTCVEDVRRLRAKGLSVALISHGSDLRVPSDHARRHPFSPFAPDSGASPDVYGLPGECARPIVDATTAKLEVQARRNRDLLARFDGPVFVSTPDLLDDAPHAVWCPTVVDPEEWSRDAPVLERAVPRVVHIPSNGHLKGSAHIDAALAPLAQTGLIDYRRLEAVGREELKREYEQADIVVDQVAMGLYGVASIEAMAAGRVVLAYLGEPVRERIRADTGLEVPIVEVTPETLSPALERLLADRAWARSRAAEGSSYAYGVHDGARSAAVLAGWLSLGRNSSRWDSDKNKS
ncbi:hypothetical protein [Piscicoccus intestinalis]|uniref:hypothetical protein n=1 Tax=Piscicoccus intestinalis TaxID=746033 RepID=UPI0012ED350B|nr:hypothetical protein [Piscicoccus intestinalis]